MSCKYRRSKLDKPTLPNCARKKDDHATLGHCGG